MKTKKSFYYNVTDHKSKSTIYVVFLCFWVSCFLFLVVSLKARQPSS